MKNTESQSIFSQALAEAVKDFAEEMGYKSVNKPEAAVRSITGRKSESGAAVLSMSKENTADKTGEIRMA